jgi:peroxiredoxin Q/BCP
MRRWLTLLATIGWLALPAIPASAGTGPQGDPSVGQAAPAFRLQDQNGHWRSPADYHGHWLVLYFYPRDFTPGCTTEVCSFRDEIVKLRQAGADVLGVSLDGVKSHAEFAAKYHVPFPLLADSSRQVAVRYGVLTSAIGLHFAKRTTFLIDPNGKIAKIYREVDPKQNAAQVLGDLTSLKKTSA